jgi:hypothetical protein
MHVWGGFWEKVHYSAVFGGGKRRKRTESSQRRDAEAQRKDLREEERDEKDRG